MYKYKNISDFRQSLVVKGKRVLLKPEDVVESETELMAVFLEKVDTSTPVSIVSEAGVTKKVDDLQQRLDGLEKEKEELAANQTKEVYDTIGELEAAIKALETKYSDLAGIMSLIKKNLDGATAQIQTVSNTNEADKKLYIKRLEMLKSAVMTIEQEVFGPAEETQSKK